MKMIMIDSDKVIQWIDDLIKYDYDLLKANLQKYHGDISPFEREAEIEKLKIINEGKILAYQNLLDSFF